jgi:hypothetical protein
MTIREKALDNLVMHECCKIRSEHVKQYVEKLDRLNNIIKSHPSEDCIKQYAKISEKLHAIDSANYEDLPEMEYYEL